MWWVLLLAPEVCVAPPTTGSRQAQAFAHQEAAFAHLRDGRYCEAVAALEAAHALDGQPGHLFNRAQAVALWPGHCVDAVAAFDRFLAAVPTGADAEEARAKKSEILKGCPEARLPIVAVPSEPAVAKHTPAREPPRELLREPPRAFEAAPWIAGGVAVLGLAAGGTFTHLALDDRDEIERWQQRGLAEATEQYRGLEDQARGAFDRDLTLAWVGWGVAGVALTTAVTLWLWDE